MTPARASRLAWTLFGLAIALLVAALVLALLSGFPSAYNWGSGAMVVAMCVPGVSSALIGALIASRQPRNSVGWVCLGIGVALGASTAASYYAYYALVTRPGGLPGGGLIAPLAGWAWLFWLAPLVVHLVLLFPDGRLPSPRWRVVAWLGGLGAGLFGVAQALLPGPVEGFPGMRNQLGVEGARGALEAMSLLGSLIFTACIPAAAVSMVLRFRRGHGVERLQIKWFAYAAAALAALVVVGSLTFFQAAGESVAAKVASDLYTVAYAAPLLATGIAILRYRLYDIDVVINRTLVYGALTATLAATYVATVLVLQLALSTVTDDSGLAVAVSTLAVAGLFRPARARIQAAVDRRFYRRKYDAQRTLEHFGARLRDELDLDAMSAELSSVVADTMQPAQLSLWLRDPKARLS